MDLFTFASLAIFLVSLSALLLIITAALSYGDDGSFNHDGPLHKELKWSFEKRRFLGALGVTLLALELSLLLMTTSPLGPVGSISGIALAVACITVTTKFGFDKRAWHNVKPAVSSHRTTSYNTNGAGLYPS